jgi:hypothetical protein
MKLTVPAAGVLSVAGQHITATQALTKYVFCLDAASVYAKASAELVLFRLLRHLRVGVECQAEAERQGEDQSHLGNLLPAMMPMIRASVKSGDMNGRLGHEGGGPMATHVGTS